MVLNFYYNPAYETIGNIIFSEMYKKVIHMMHNVQVIETTLKITSFVAVNRINLNPKLFTTDIK